MNTTTQIRDKSVIITEQTLSQLIDDSINNSSFSESETVQLTSYALTAIIKLSIKFRDTLVIEHLRLILNSKTHDTNLEIQTRAVEYEQIFGQDSTLKRGLLARMPPPPVKQRESLTLQKSTSSNKSIIKKTANGSSGVAGGNDNLLLDLMNDDVTTGSTQSQPDLLNDILSGSGGGGSNTTANKPVNNAAILDLFNTPSSSSQTAVTSPSAPASASAAEIVAFNNASVKVAFIPKSFPQNGQATMEVLITSNTNSTIEQFELMFAVPKGQKLTISTTAGGDSLIPGGSPIRQNLKVIGKQGAKIKFRVKVKYTSNGIPTEEQFDFAGFKNTL